MFLGFEFPSVGGVHTGQAKFFAVLNSVTFAERMSIHSPFRMDQECPTVVARRRLPSTIVCHQEGTHPYRRRVWISSSGNVRGVAEDSPPTAGRGLPALPLGRFTVDYRFSGMTLILPFR